MLTSTQKPVPRKLYGFLHLDSIRGILTYSYQAQVVKNPTLDKHKN